MIKKLLIFNLILLHFSCTTEQEIEYKTIVVGYENSFIQKKLDSLNITTKIEVEKIDSTELRKYYLLYNEGTLYSILKDPVKSIDSVLIKPNKNLHKIYSSSFENHKDVIKFEIQDHNKLEKYFINSNGIMDFISINDEPRFEYLNADGIENAYEYKEQEYLIQLLTKTNQKELYLFYKLLIETKDGCISFIISRKNELNENLILKDNNLILKLSEIDAKLELQNYEHCDSTISKTFLLYKDSNNRLTNKTPLNLLE